MRRIWVPLGLLLAWVLPTHAATERTLGHTVSAAGVERVAIEAGVGDIRVLAVAGETVDISVVLTPRRGGVFSSMRQAERDVEQSELRSDISNGQLALEVAADSDDPRFEERWTVRIPARIGVELQLGVGDIAVTGLAGSVDVEVGVGDVTVEDAAGDVFANAGVGEVTVSGSADSYGSVSVSGGVGDVGLTVRGTHVDSQGVVGRSATWSGPGPARIDVEVGVGDASITLQ